MEEITLKKREIEAKLEEEKASIEWLKESLQKSDQLTNNMLNILASFEDRLIKLEDTILPVHKETTDLQLRQENVDRTLVLLDEVLSYHSVSANLKPIIEEGPTGHLTEYLESMEKIDQAVTFFQKNNPDSIELSVLTSLSDSAKESLQKEFLLLLKRNSKPVPVVTISDILNNMTENADTISELSVEDADTQIQHFSERVQDDLATIAKWLTDHKKGTDFMSVYSQIRSQKLQASVQGIKDEGFKFNFDAIVGKKKPGLTKRQNTDIYAKMKLGPKKSTKQVIETFYGGHRRQASTIMESSGKEEDENAEANTFITCTYALLKLMQSEKQLMQFIIPAERQIPIFSQLVEKTLVIYYQDAESICNNAKKLQNKLDHSAMQLILPITKYLRMVKPEFDNLLKMVNVDTRNKFINTGLLFEDTGSKCLNEFVEKLKDSDKQVTMPKDGTVHQVTSNVTILLEELNNYLETTASILACNDPKYSKMTIDDVNAKRIMTDFTCKLLEKLSFYLLTKSKLYDTSALQSIFILNNYNYILKSLIKIGIIGMLKENGQPNLENDYNGVIEENLKAYERSWVRVTHHLELDPSDKTLDAAGKGGHLKDKHKQAIKDKFKGFNTDIEEIKQIHGQFAVPDMSLKKGIYDRICELVLPKYTEFLKRYRDVHFTKNLEKYVKYDLERVRTLIGNIYALDNSQR